MKEEKQLLLHDADADRVSTGQLTRHHHTRKTLALLVGLLALAAVAVIAVTLPIVHSGRLAVSHAEDAKGVSSSRATQQLLGADASEDQDALLEYLSDVNVFNNSRTDAESRVRNILRHVPLIDGHNDLAYQIRNFYHNQFDKVHLEDHLDKLNTDISRLREGQLGGQFWSCYVSCNTQYSDAVRVTLDQCDTIWRFVEKYPDVFERVETADGIMHAFRRGRIASMIGVEGGHSMDSSLATLRQLYRLGARYMTLTHTCHTPWADTSGQLDDPEEATPLHGGLTEWGDLVVKEMNRLGMLVDLSHVAKATQEDALRVSRAPVIFSHSSAWRLCHHNRNVHDDILRLLEENGGLVMVSFVPQFTGCPPYQGPTDVAAVADHIEHVRDVAGVDHVGIGSDFEGVASHVEGLEDVSKFPSVFIELARRGWSDRSLAKLAGLNLIRVFKAVEQVRDRLQALGVPPYDEHIPECDLPSESASCRTDF